MAGWHNTGLHAEYSSTPPKMLVRPLQALGLRPFIHLEGPMAVQHTGSSPCAGYAVMSRTAVMLLLNDMSSGHRLAQAPDKPLAKGLTDANILAVPSSQLACGDTYCAV